MCLALRAAGARAKELSSFPFSPTPPIPNRREFYAGLPVPTAVWTPKVPARCRNVSSGLQMVKHGRAGRALRHGKDFPRTAMCLRTYSVAEVQVVALVWVAAMTDQGGGVCKQCRDLAPSPCRLPSGCKGRRRKRRRGKLVPCLFRLHACVILWKRCKSNRRRRGDKS